MLYIISTIFLVFVAILAISPVSRVSRGLCILMTGAPGQSRMVGEPDNVILSVFVSRTLHRTLLRGMKQAKKFPFLSITFKFSSKRSSDFRPPETSTLHAAGMLLKTQRGVLIVKNDVSFVFFLARVKQNKGVSLKRF